MARPFVTDRDNYASLDRVFHSRDEGNRRSYCQNRFT